MYRRSKSENSCGGDGRENAGMSNEKTGEIPVRRKPEVSRVKAICPGVSRPLSCRTEGMTHRVKRGRAMVDPVEAAR